MKPHPGLIIRCDYIWGYQNLQNLSQGSKDRPCVVVGGRQTNDGSYSVFVCPITREKPPKNEPNIAIPPRIAVRCGLDSKRQWVITKETNLLHWPRTGTPREVHATRDGRPAFGVMPDGLFQAVIEDVRAHGGHKQYTQRISGRAYRKPDSDPDRRKRADEHMFDPDDLGKIHSHRMKGPSFSA